MADCESENMHCDQKRKWYFDYMKRLWLQRWLCQSLSSVETQCTSTCLETVGLMDFTWHGLEWCKLTWWHDWKVKWPLPALNNNEWDLPAAWKTSAAVDRSKETLSQQSQTLLVQDETALPQNLVAVSAIDLQGAEGAAAAGCVVTEDVDGVCCVRHGRLTHDGPLFQKVCLCCPQGCIHGIREVWSQWRLQSHRR